MVVENLRVELEMGDAVVDFLPDDAQVRRQRILLLECPRYPSGRRPIFVFEDPQLRNI